MLPPDSTILPSSHTGVLLSISPLDHGSQNDALGIAAVPDHERSDQWLKRPGRTVLTGCQDEGGAVISVPISISAGSGRRLDRADSD